MNDSTLLCYMRSKDPDLITQFVRQLPYKIEIKSGIMFDGKKYYLSYILPDGFKGEIRDIDLDG